MRLRRIGRAVLPARSRSRIATLLQDLANLRYRFHPNYRENQRRLRALKGSERGRTCIIIGNGASMTDFDLSRLDGVDAFCLNRGHLLWSGTGRRPRYLVAINPLVIEQFGPELAAVEATRLLPWEYHERFPGPGNLFFTLDWRRRFSRDLETGLWGGGTVTFAAMQIAYHLGYSRVVLIGVDHSFDFVGEPNQRLVAVGPDGNHFSPDYFSNGAEWHAPDLALSEKSYAMARDAFAADGREIVDSTEGGQLRIFPQMTLEEALRS